MQDSLARSTEVPSGSPDEQRLRAVLDGLRSIADTADPHWRPRLADARAIVEGAWATLADLLDETPHAGAVLDLLRRLTVADDAVLIRRISPGVLKGRVAELLGAEGIAVTVADARFAKPIDAALMAQLAAEHDLLVTVEEGVLQGGFGTAVWESLSERGISPRILRVGLPDRYVTHGAPNLLHQEVGFTPDRIAERVLEAVAERDQSIASV